MACGCADDGLWQQPKTMFLPFLPMLEDLETPVEVDMQWGVQ